MFGYFDVIEVWEFCHSSDFYIVIMNLYSLWQHK